MFPDNEMTPCIKLFHIHPAEVQIFKKTRCSRYGLLLVRNHDDQYQTFVSTSFERIEEIRSQATISLPGLLYGNICLPLLQLVKNFTEKLHLGSKVACHHHSTPLDKK